MQRLAAGLEQRRVAVAEAVELGDEIAPDLARRVHALREIGQLRVLVLEQVDEVGQRHLAAVARAEDAQRDRQRARLLLMRRRVLQVQHVAERGRGKVGQQLLLVVGQLVDAVGQQRDRDRAARGAARREDGDVDGVGELLALAAALGELVVVGAPDVGVGVAAEIALAVDEHGRDALQEQLLDEAQRERRLARARAAEHGGVALQHVLVERDRACRVRRARVRPGCSCRCSPFSSRMTDSGSSSSFAGRGSAARCPRMSPTTGMGAGQCRAIRRQPLPLARPRRPRRPCRASAGRSPGGRGAEAG